MFGRSRSRKKNAPPIPVGIEAESPVRIDPRVIIASSITVGKYSFIGPNTTFGPNASRIGRYCSIGSGSIIGPNIHPLNELSTSAAFYSAKWGLVDFNKKAEYNLKPTLLEHDVWLGHNAIIMPGVTLGTGCVIAAGAVVTKDVKPYEIVAGTPARHLKFRFDEDVVQRLLDSRWWELDDQEVVNFYNEFRNWQSNS